MSPDLGRGCGNAQEAVQPETEVWAHTGQTRTKGTGELCAQPGLPRAGGLRRPAHQCVVGAMWFFVLQMPQLSLARLDILLRVSPSDSFCLPTRSGESARL